MVINDAPNVINAANVENQLREHINRGRTLRIVLHPSDRGPFSFNAATPSGPVLVNYHEVAGFIIVRMLGYNDDGLLVEFINQDTSCGRSETNP